MEKGLDHYIPHAVAVLILGAVAFVVILSVISYRPEPNTHSRTGILASESCAPVVERYGLDRMNENQKARNVADGVLATGARIVYVVCDSSSHDLALIGLRNHRGQDLTWQVRDGLLALSSLVGTGR
jgi:hypothetical protein